MKQPYTLTALFAPPSPETHLDSATDDAAHRQFHAAGIPQFQLTQAQILMYRLQFHADPDPMCPQYPKETAQKAAQIHLCREIHAHWPHTTNIKFKLEPAP